MATLEIQNKEIGLRVGETVSIPVVTDAEDFSFTNDSTEVVSVEKKKSSLLFKGLVKGASTVVVSAPEAEDVRLIVSVYEKEESGTVHFDANGGSGEMADRSIALNETLSLPESEFTAPEGKVFIGWSEEADGSSGVKDVNSLVQFHQEGEHTFYAIYEDQPEQPEPSPEPKPEPDPKPEPEPEKPDVKPDEYLSEEEIATLLTKIQVNWELTLDKLYNEAFPKYKVLISKLKSYNDKYGPNSLSRYVPKENAGRIFDLYKTLLDVLDTAKDYQLRFNNFVTLINAFFFKYSSTFTYKKLTEELVWWIYEAPFKPTKSDVNTWRILAKILAELANEITRVAKKEEIKFDELIEDETLVISSEVRGLLKEYYK